MKKNKQKKMERSANGEIVSISFIAMKTEPEDKNEDFIRQLHSDTTFMTMAEIIEKSKTQTKKY